METASLNRYTSVITLVIYYNGAHTLLNNIILIDCQELNISSHITIKIAYRPHTM